MKLYIIRDSNYQDWQAYEVHQIGGRRLLHTEDWAEVIKLLGDNIPEPEVVIVD